jgi:hypothetical protein
MSLPRISNPHPLKNDVDPGSDTSFAARFNTARCIERNSNVLTRRMQRDMTELDTAQRKSEMQIVSPCHLPAEPSLEPFGNSNHSRIAALHIRSYAEWNNLSSQVARLH